MSGFQLNFQIRYRIFAVTRRLGLALDKVHYARDSFWSHQTHRAPPSDVDFSPAQPYDFTVAPHNLKDHETTFRQ